MRDQVASCARHLLSPSPLLPLLDTLCPTTSRRGDAGMWGILWFREIRGCAALAWCAAAAVTMASVVLLGFEKGS